MIHYIIRKKIMYDPYTMTDFVKTLFFFFLNIFIILRLFIIFIFIFIDFKIFIKLVFN